MIYHSKIIALIFSIYFLNLSVSAKAEQTFYITDNSSNPQITAHNGDKIQVQCNPHTITVELGLPQDFEANPHIDWAVSSNFTYTTSSFYTSQIFVTLDANHNDGSVSAVYRGELITVYITQKPSPSFTVTPTLCTSGASGDFSATLNFYGPGSANITWETTGGITVNGSNTYKVYDNTISRATIQHNSYGSLSLYGELTGCDNLQSQRVTIYIGTPTSSDISFNTSPNADPGFRICTNQSYNFHTSPSLPESQYQLNWSVPNGRSNLNYYYAYGQNVTLSSNSPGGGFVLQLDMTNTACNTTGSTSRTFGIFNCNSYYRVASNPASSNLAIMFDPVDELKYFPNNIKLVHEKNGVVKDINLREKTSTESIKDGAVINIDIKSLSRDVYYLHATYDEGVTQIVRVVIQ